MSTAEPAPRRMVDALGEAVQQHHVNLLATQRRYAELLDRRAAIETELRQIDTQIAAAERATRDARELLAMSWEHYRSEMERR